MFHLYQHHDAATLADLLAALRERAGTDSPLIADTIIVPNRGTGRWLQAELAAGEGAAANLHLPLMAEFVWSTFRAGLPDVPPHSDYARERLVWHLYALLPTLAIPEVRQYLAATPPERQRLQLAQRLAEVFDQYLIHRRDLLADWEQGRNAEAPPANWQAPVWRALVARLGPRHRARLLTELLQRAATGDFADAHLPARIHAFALVDLPNDYLHLLHALGRHTEVHFLLPNPSAAWWGDVVRAPVAAPELPAEADPDTGHPLLASLGRAGRDFLRLLHADELAANRHEPDLGDRFAPAPPAGDGLLARIQAGIVDGEAPVCSTGIARDDRSLQIHACHGPLREAQVLHDQLLDLLVRMPDLEPRDVLVLLPDVGRHAAAIRSVFDAARGRRRIPYRIADRPRIDTHPIARTFATLIDLPLARWTTSEILGLAGVPAVMRRFELDESDLELLHVWLAEAGVRWGLDAESRAALGAAAWTQNTWRFGLDRLLLGLAQSRDGVLVDGVAPWPGLEGGAAAATGRLWLLLDRLRYWRDRLCEPVPAADWQERLNAMIRDLFVPDPDDPAESAALTTLFEAAASLEPAADCIGDEALSREAIREVLLGALGGSGQRQPLVSGGVTFAGIEPLRGVPFRVICLLGMDDGAFPRQDGDRSFNELRARPRVGDPSLRDSDRMIFLQSLMAARDCFYLSYSGRDLADGAELQPSPVVGELIDFVQGHFCAGHEPGTARRALVTEQRLHPFSPRYFATGNDGLFTFSADWRDAAVALAGPRTEPGGFVDTTALPGPDPQEPVDIGDLVRFYSHPARWFFRECLRLELDPATRAPADEEPLTLDGLERYHLRERLFARARAAGGSAIDATPDPLERALGRLPPPPLGADDYAGAAADVNAILPAWRAWNDAGGGTTVEVDVACADGIRVCGAVTDVGAREMLCLRPGRLRLKHLLPAWLRWLALVAGGHDIPLRVVGANAGEADERGASLERHRALELLQDAVAIHRTGCRRPLLFEPYLAEHYLDQRDKTTRATGAIKTPAEALHGTNGWLNNSYQPAVPAGDPWLQPLFTGWPDPLGNDPDESAFVDACERIGRPLRAHLAATAGPPEAGA